jgi:hypothetical protein
MKTFKSNYLYLLLLVPLFTGCTKKIPSCSNKLVLDTVEGILYDNVVPSNIKDKLNKEQFLEYAEMKKTGVISFEENIDKYTCEGWLSINGSREMYIKYESYLHDETKEHMISVENSLGADLMYFYEQLRNVIGMK